MLLDCTSQPARRRPVVGMHDAIRDERAIERDHRIPAAG
jgi:hypothetical protein